AATNTFIAQLVALYLIALKLGQDRGTLGYDELDRLKDQLRSLPRAAQYVLDRADEIRNLAKKYGNARDVFYIGRHANYPVALEGALKLKEISYIHAEAYAAGELKHGPLALVTPATPVIAVAVQDPTYEKMRSNIGEVSARGSPVLAIGTEGDKELPKFIAAIHRKGSSGSARSRTTGRLSVVRESPEASSRRGTITARGTSTGSSWRGESGSTTGPRAASSSP